MTDLGRLGRFTLLRRLAAGGMGEVYLGEVQGAANFTRRVAIKRILPHLARDEGFVRKFIDEAHLMVQLHHGNIVPVQELNDEDGELYIVMEYLPGRDLKAVIRRLKREKRTLDPDLAMWLTAELCAGLDYAHHKVDADGRSLEIVHRDVSPSNIVLGAGGEIKLLDFGIARARGGLHQSISGTLQGKFVYMSPEQADGRAVGPAADIFSAGLVLYELLTGTRPFNSASETETLRLARRCEIEPPSTVVASLSPEIDAVIMRALAPEPADRWPSAGAFRKALFEVISARGGHADARTLANELDRLFPEGVVPSDAPDTPLSLDDALKLQLGAVTPTGGPTPTHTHTGPSAARRPISTSAPAYNRRATDDALASTITHAPIVSVTAPGPGEAPKGRKRFMFMGLALGALVTGGAVLYSQSQVPDLVPLQVNVTPEGLENVRLTQGPIGPEFDSGQRFPAGKRLEICARATGHLRSCKYHIPTEGQALDLSLRPMPRLLPKPSRDDVPFVLRIGRDGPVLHGPPYYLKGYDQPIDVCVEVNDPRFEIGVTCYRIVADSPTAELKFNVLEVPQDAGVPAETPDAGVGPTRVRRPRPRTTPVKLVVEPSTASIDCGSTPVLRGGTVQVGANGATCQVSAEGFWRRSVRLTRGSKSVQTVRLLKPGRISGRVKPDMAKLSVGGALSKTSAMNNRSVSPYKPVKLTATFQGKTVRLTVPVSPGVTQTFHMDVVAKKCRVGQLEKSCE